MYPGALANYFGANPDALNFLTPVFFRPEVLAKYYADPGNIRLKTAICVAEASGA
ncbi:MAG: hypothetical protein R3F31_08240 [Verrucomicrobiales bacterium]